MLGWPGPSAEQSWNKTSRGNQGKTVTHWNLKTVPLQSRGLLKALLHQTDKIKLKWQQHSDVDWMLLSHQLCTFPCLHHHHSHTQTLLHWTVPSPPPVTVGNQEEMEEAWAWAGWGVESQTEQEKNKQTKGRLCYKCLWIQQIASRLTYFKYLAKIGF